MFTSAISRQGTSWGGGSGEEGPGEARRDTPRDDPPTPRRRSPTCPPNQRVSDAVQERPPQDVPGKGAHCKSSRLSEATAAHGGQPELLGGGGKCGSRRRRASEAAAEAAGAAAARMLLGVRVTHSPPPQPCLQGKQEILKVRKQLGRTFFALTVVPSLARSPPSPAPTRSLRANQGPSRPTSLAFARCTGLGSGSCA